MVDPTISAAKDASLILYGDFLEDPNLCPIWPGAEVLESRGLVRCPLQDLICVPSVYQIHGKVTVLASLTKPS